MGESRVQLRCTTDEKAAWEKAAGLVPLSRWMRHHLNAAAAGGPYESVPPAPTEIKEPADVAPATANLGPNTAQGRSSWGKPDPKVKK